MVIKKPHKTLSLIGILALCLSLCACSAPVQTTPDTCSITSAYQMAETEKGYYSVVFGKLCYADKSDLTNWVPVCNQPDCEHLDDSCPAEGVEGGFLLQNNRIYSTRYTLTIEEHPTTSNAIYSIAPDGTDLRLEYPLDIFPVDAGITCSHVWSPDGIYWSYCLLDTDGTYDYKISRLDENGMHELYQWEHMDEFFPYLTSASLYQKMQGDFAAYSVLLSGLEELFGHLYRPTEDGLEEIPGICDYDVWGAYLDGNTLYHYVKNEGFLQTDLTTGKSKKRMDAQLADGQGYQITPDFLVETNMVYGNAPGTPELRICRNGKWQTVTLPDNMWPGENGGFDIRALTSEHLFVAMQTVRRRRSGTPPESCPMRATSSK